MKHKRTLEVSRFDVNLRGLVLPMGLRIESVTMAGFDVRCTYSPISVTAEEPGELQVFVSERDLSQFLNSMGSVGLKNVSVEARDGALHIRATKTVLIDMKAYAVCSLRIVDGKRLFVDLESVEIMGVGPKHLIQSQLDKINPVVDMDDFPIPATMDTVEISQGGILLRGRVEPPQ